MFNMYNPIRSVGGNDVPCPSKYRQIISDISAPDSGRTEDGKMWKEKIGQLAKIELEWNYLKSIEIAQVLNAFDAEYVNVEFLDAKTGGFRSAVFYVGDRTAPLYNSRLDLWEGLSLNIIERVPR